MSKWNPQISAENKEEGVPLRCSHHMFGVCSAVATARAVLGIDMWRAVGARWGLKEQLSRFFKPFEGHNG